jgi:hypothetical protein
MSASRSFFIFGLPEVEMKQAVRCANVSVEHSRRWRELIFSAPRTPSLRTWTELLLLQNKPDSVRRSFVDSERNADLRVRWGDLNMDRDSGSTTE